MVPVHIVVHANVVRDPAINMDIDSSLPDLCEHVVEALEEHISVGCDPKSVVDEGFSFRVDVKPSRLAVGFSYAHVLSS